MSAIDVLRELRPLLHADKYDLVAYDEALAAVEELHRAAEAREELLAARPGTTKAWHSQGEWDREMAKANARLAIALRRVNGENK